MGNSYKGQEGRGMSAFYKQTKRINVKEWNKLFKIKENVGRRYTYKVPPNESKPSKRWVLLSTGLTEQWELLQS